MTVSRNGQEWRTKSLEERLELTDPFGKAVPSAVQRQKGMLTGTMIGENRVYGHIFIKCTYYVDTYQKG